MFYSFDALIRPNFMYGSDIWGYNKSGTQLLDKFFQNFIRYTLHIKATACNPIVYGVYGVYGMLSHFNELCQKWQNKDVQSINHHDPD